MERLLELAKKLEEYKEELEKASKIGKQHIDHSGEYGPMVGKTKNVAVHKSLDERLDDLLEKAQMSSKIKPQRKSFKVTPESTTIPSKPKVESPKPGTKSKPMPIGEKGKIAVAHTGAGKDGMHYFDIHRDGKRVGGAHIEKEREEDGSPYVGSGHSKAESHTEDEHDKEIGDVEDIIHEHVKKHPHLYKSLDERLDDLLEKACSSKDVKKQEIPVDVTSMTKEEDKKGIPKASVKNQSEHGPVKVTDVKSGTTKVIGSVGSIKFKPEVKKDDGNDNSEIYKTNANGQWSIAKAEKAPYVENSGDKKKPEDNKVPDLKKE